MGACTSKETTAASTDAFTTTAAKGSSAIDLPNDLDTADALRKVLVALQQQQQQQQQKQGPKNTINDTDTGRSTTLVETSDSSRGEEEDNDEDDDDDDSSAIIMSPSDLEMMEDAQKKKLPLPVGLQHLSATRSSSSASGAASLSSSTSTDAVSVLSSSQRSSTSNKAAALLAANKTKAKKRELEKFADESRQKGRTRKSSNRAATKSVAPSSSSSSSSVEPSSLKRAADMPHQQQHQQQNVLLTKFGGEDNDAFSEEDIESGEFYLVPVKAVVEDDEKTGTGGSTTGSGVVSHNKPIRRVISKNSLLIENAYNESQVVDMVAVDSKTEKHEEMELPLDITNKEAMEAASITIKEVIDTKGSITAAESAEIIQQKMRTLKLLWNHFPGAVPSSQVLEGYKQVVERRGYTPENTLFAQSICPDEINHEDGAITNLFTKYSGDKKKVFHMGGLAGIPFTGKVGFGAFSHHVPDDDGHCSILMAPHIGMDSDGKFGRYNRDGQHHSGSCCGAAVGAYVHCRECKQVPDLSTDPEHYQFNYIVNQVNKGMNLITGETECEKQASLAIFMHYIGSDMLKNCVNLEFGSSKSTLVILTGIQINMPRPFCDFFVPLEFYILKKDDVFGTMKEDVFEEAFGYDAKTRHDTTTKP